MENAETSQDDMFRSASQFDAIGVAENKANPKIGTTAISLRRS